MAAETPSAGTLPTSRVWTLDHHHSTVGFAIKHHAVGTFRGRFLEFEAQFDAEAGTLTGSAKTSSLDVFDMLKEHLLADEFLAAAAQPTISFASTSVKDDGGVLTVEGDLTMKGITKPVTARGGIIGPSKVAGWEGPDQEHIGMDLEITIDRREFGIDFNNELLDGQMNLGWDVTLDFSLEFFTPLDDESA